MTPTFSFIILLGDYHICGLALKRAQKWVYGNTMKLKHRIRNKILSFFESQAGSCSSFTLKQIRKGIDGEFADELTDKSERKAAIMAEVERLVEKGQLLNADELYSLPLEDESVLEKTATNDNARKGQKRKASEDNVMNNSECGSSEGKHPQKRNSGSTDANLPAENASNNQVTEGKPPPVGNNTILLFYAYCNPSMTRAEQVTA